MEKVQVTMAVSGDEKVRKLRVPIVALWIVREGDVQRLIAGVGDGNAMTARYLWEGPPGPLTAERGDAVCAVLADLAYERLYAHIGLQGTLPSVGEAASR